jgi:hypothetical protein
MSARRHWSCARSALDCAAGAAKAQAQPSDAAAAEDSDVVVGNSVDQVVLELARAIPARRRLEDMDGPHGVEPEEEYDHGGNMVFSLPFLNPKL